MTFRIEDYGMIGDCHTAALVARDGSIDWLCLPSFDSAACFAALLGDSENGRWLIAPDCEIKKVTRKYRDDTLILETTFETEGGTVTLVDLMTPATETPDLIRLVVGVRGTVPMRMELSLRFDYGSVVPWVRSNGSGIVAIAVPDTVHLRTPVKLEGENFKTTARFTISAGETIPFDLCWYASHRDEPNPLDVEKAIAETEAWWREWVGRCKFEGRSKAAVIRSLITLKALTLSRPAGSSLRPRLRCPSESAECATGITGFAGCAMPRYTLRNGERGLPGGSAGVWREWLVRAVAGKRRSRTSFRDRAESAG